MFVGHFGVGFGAKAAAPRVSLGTLFLAAQFLDLLWPTLVLLGVERVEVRPGVPRVPPLDFVSYPISHSLVTAVVWAAGLAAVHRAVRRDPRAAAVVGAAVLSHWLLDLVVHRPDLPLAPWSEVKVGLGLWSSLELTLLVEVPIFLGGVALYARSTRPRDRAGRIGLPALVLFLLAVYAANLVGPAPPGPEAVAWAAQAQWLLVGVAYWLDRHRAPRASPRAPTVSPRDV